MTLESPAGAMEKQQHFVWGMIHSTVPSYAMIVPPQDKFLMLYIRGGMGEITQGENNWRAERGDLFFLRSGLIYLIHSANEPLTFASLQISGPCKNFSFVYHIEPGTPMEQQVEDLMETSLLSFPGASMPQLGIFLSFLKSSESLQSPAKHLGCTHTDILKLILDTRFAESLHLEQFTNELHLNKYKLVKDFKAQYGLPPIEYLIKRRIQEACRLLQETEKSVTAIGAEVGIDNTPYFIRTFKKKIGCTPFAYRKSIRSLYLDKK